MIKYQALGAAVAAAAVLATACSGTTSTSSTPPASAPAAATHTAPTPVPVKMSEFHLDLPAQSFSPGAYSFVATNVGQKIHALEINGPGVADQRTPSVPAGQSATLTVTLQPGSYEIYCPVANHKAMGMDTHITVGGAAAPAAPTTAPTTIGGGSSGY